MSVGLLLGLSVGAERIVLTGWFVLQIDATIDINEAFKSRVDHSTFVFYEKSSKIEVKICGCAVI